MTFSIHTSGAARAAIDETVPSLVHDLGRLAHHRRGTRRSGGRPPRLRHPSGSDGWKPCRSRVAGRRDRRAGAPTSTPRASRASCSRHGRFIACPRGHRADRRSAADHPRLDGSGPGARRSRRGPRRHGAGGLLEVRLHGRDRLAASHLRSGVPRPGIDPVERIVVVTDPGSPLDVSAREAGYRVFNADPNVGGRYSSAHRPSASCRRARRCRHRRAAERGRGLASGGRRRLGRQPRPSSGRGDRGDDTPAATSSASSPTARTSRASRIGSSS